MRRVTRNIRPRNIDREVTVRVPVVTCLCKSEVECLDSANDCPGTDGDEKCLRVYNGLGQELRPRAEWPAPADDETASTGTNP